MKTSTRPTGPATDNGYHICWPPLFRAGTPKLMVNPAPPENVPQTERPGFDEFLELERHDSNFGGVNRAAQRCPFR
jgi:hypothetical protein